MIDKLVESDNRFPEITIKPTIKLYSFKESLHLTESIIMHPCNIVARFRIFQYNLR